jgi:hypothetical protein
MRPLLPLFLLLLGAGCAQPDPGATAEVLQNVLASHQASLSGIGSGSVAGAARGSTPAANGAAAMPPAAVASAAPPVPAAPRLQGESPPAAAGQLVGQGPETVTRWLGEPRLRRAEGGAEIWHYQATQCHLDIVLYREDGPQAGLRVAFAAARAVGTTRRGEAACLRDIARGALLRPGPAPSAGQSETG